MWHLLRQALRKHLVEYEVFFCFFSHLRFLLVESISQPICIKIFPCNVIQVRYELFFLHSIVEFTKTIINEIIKELFVNKPILFGAVLIFLVVHINLLIILNVIGHVFNNSCKNHHEEEGFFEIFVTNWDGRQNWLRHHLETRCLDFCATLALKNTKK